MRPALLVIALILTGCPKNPALVRDAKTYEAEVQFFSMAATRQADQLAEFIASSCSCVEGAWSGSNQDLCASSALNVQTVGARIEWHAQMMRYNGGLIDERPPEEPPAIPSATDLCPMSDEARIEADEAEAEATPAIEGEEQ